MPSFFTEEKIKTFTTNIKSDIQTCSDCGRHQEAKTPRMQVYGKGKRGVLVIGGSPSFDSDINGIPFKDEYGLILSSYFRGSGVDLYNDCWLTYACNCFYFSEPKEKQIQICSTFLEKTIKKLQPKFIITLGKEPIISLMPRQFKADINLWRGLCIPSKKYNCWVIPLASIEHLFDYQKNGNYISQYKRDIRNATICLNKKAPLFYDYDSEIQCITDFQQIKNVLENFSNKYFIFDFETSGLNPYKKGHKIVSISFSYGKETYSFPYDKGIFSIQEKEEIRKRLKIILENPNILKIAHNLKFEHKWAKEILGIEVQGWHWCSMTNAHILDNRRGFTSLDFQGFCNFGIEPYDGYIKPFKESDRDGFNTIHLADMGKLLLYGGRDSAITKMLFNKQRIEFERKGKKINEAREFFTESLFSLLEIEQNGFPVNEEYYHKANIILEKKMNDVLQEIEKDKIFINFEKRYFRKLDIQKNKDLEKIIYEILKTQEQRTEKNNLITDKNVLEKINVPFTNNILLYRKYKHVKDFIENMLKSITNDKVHCTIDLNIATTFRGNCHSPNLQNVNIREEFSKKMCRSGFTCDEESRILESDFSGIEVSIGACYHKDPKMIEYLTHPESDMHRDCACDIWMLEAEEITKDIRFYAKNCWTFPQFYGDWYDSCARQLWENCRNLKMKSGMTLIDWLLDHTNVRHLNDFIEHCREVERIFWEERFSTYYEWKQDINNFYIQHGYIESFLGFHFQGFISRKDASNYVIQGTAFHMLLWTLTQIRKKIKELKMQSKLILQIHDSQIYKVLEKECKNLVKLIDYYGTIKIKEQFDWIIVPMKIEHELTGINGVWTDKEPIVFKDNNYYFDRKDGLVLV